MTLSGIWSFIFLQACMNVVIVYFMTCVQCRVRNLHCQIHKHISHLPLVFNCYLVEGETNAIHFLIFFQYYISSSNQSESDFMDIINVASTMKKSRIRRARAYLIMKICILAGLGMLENKKNYEKILADLKLPQLYGARLVKFKCSIM